MSIFTLNIRTNNAAFEEDSEVPYILNQIGAKVALGRSFGHVLDTNGNIVGSYEGTYDHPDHDPDEDGPTNRERGQELYEKLKEHLEEMGLEVDSSYITDDALSTFTELLVQERGNKEWRA